jgi:hypothetical protein
MPGARGRENGSGCRIWLQLQVRSLRRTHDGSAEPLIRKPLRAGGTFLAIASLLRRDKRTSVFDHEGHE